MADDFDDRDPFDDPDDDPGGDDSDDGVGDDLGDELGDDLEDRFGDGDFDDLGDDLGDEGFNEGHQGQGPVLDARESALVRQDLVELEQLELAFRDGYRGVAVFCEDCREEHYYPWEMLRENLNMLLETGETPVHEPAYEPDPHEYIPWQYARGYVDALEDAGVHERRDLDACPRCGLGLGGELAQASFCPRCGAVLLVHRLVETLAARGLSDEEVAAILREAGLPGEE